MKVKHLMETMILTEVSLSPSFPIPMNREDNWTLFLPLCPILSSSLNHLLNNAP